MYTYNDRQTDRLAGWRADRLAGRQTDRQTDRQPDKQKDKLYNGTLYGPRYEKAFLPRLYVRQRMASLKSDNGLIFREIGRIRTAEVTCERCYLFGRTGDGDRWPSRYKPRHCLDIHADNCGTRKTQILPDDNSDSLGQYEKGGQTPC